MTLQVCHTQHLQRNHVLHKYSEGKVWYANTVYINFVGEYLVQSSGPREGHHAGTAVLAFSLNTSCLIFLVQPTQRTTVNTSYQVFGTKLIIYGLTSAIPLGAPSGGEGSQTQAKYGCKVDKAHQHLHKGWRQ